MSSNSESVNIGQSSLQTFSSLAPADLPKISIVTPSFNQGHFLEDCIDSILSQNYPNLEYIIMDGGSTDLSTCIIKKYQKYLTYWQSAPDGGHYPALNEGFKRCTGDIMAWLNSDDKYHSDALFKVAAAFLRYPAAEWLTGKATTWNRQGELEAVDEQQRCWTRDYFLHEAYTTRHFLQQESTFWKRSLWRKAGGFLREDMRLASDFELWLRFSRYAQCHTLNERLGGFRRYDEQRSSRMFDKYLEEVSIGVHQELVHSSDDLNDAVSSKPYSLVLKDSDTLRLKLLCPEASPITLLTSIAPGSLEKQKNAVNSWLALGFNVISVNSAEELNTLAPLYEGVEFYPVQRNAKEEVGKPLVYLDDIMQCCRERESHIFGLINSDIQLRPNMGARDFTSFIAEHVQDSFIFASRVDIEDLDSTVGDIHVYGFDLFLFQKDFLTDFPSSRFCLGLPWWDYFLPYIAFEKGLKLKYLSPTCIYHVQHPANYSDYWWIRMGVHFSRYVDVSLFERLKSLLDEEEIKCKSALAKIAIQYNGFLQDSARLLNCDSRPRWPTRQGEKLIPMKEYEQLKRGYERTKLQQDAWKKAAWEINQDLKKLQGEPKVSS